jgi:hypothetical protein
MSQADLEAWRLSIEELRTGTSQLDREAWLANTSEFWDPEIELDVSEASGRGVSGTYLGRSAVQEVVARLVPSLGNASL